MSPYRTRFAHPDGTLEDVPEGWSWVGFFFPWVWALMHGFPGLALGFVLTIVGVVFLDLALGTFGLLAALAAVYLGLVVAINGNAWRRSALRASGFRATGAARHNAATRTCVRCETHTIVGAGVCGRCGNPLRSP